MFSLNFAKLKRHIRPIIIVVIAVLCIALYIIYQWQNANGAEGGYFVSEFANLNQSEYEYYQFIVDMKAQGTADTYKTYEKSYKTYGKRSAKNVFIGDSIFYRIRWHELVPDANQVVTRAIGAEKVQGVTARLDTIAALSPQNIYLMTGINNILVTNNWPLLLEQGLMDNYDKLFREMKKQMPDTKVYVASVLPVGATHPKSKLENFAELNTTIQEVNRLLSEMCSEYGYVYIDVYSHVVDENNCLKDGYSLDDLHPNSMGEIAVWEAIKPYYQE